jgi:hypothetical protein
MEESFQHSCRIELIGRSRAAESAVRNLPAFPVRPLSGILNESSGERTVKFRPWQAIVLVICVVVSVCVFYRGHQVDEGRDAFNRLSCPSCHIAGGAPSLEHVGDKYDRQTLLDFISNPETVYARLGRKPLNKGYATMPRPQASHEEVEMLSYFLAAQH